VEKPSPPDGLSMAMLQRLREHLAKIEGRYKVLIERRRVSKASMESAVKRDREKD
jgi:hypothetical protein